MRRDQAICGRHFYVVLVFNFYAAQGFRFRPVWRQKIAAGYDLLAQAVNRILFKQSAAALAYANRVNNQGKAALLQNGAIARMIGAEKSIPVLAAAILKPSSTVRICSAAKFRRRRENSGYGLAILGRERGYYRHAVTFQGHDGLEIGLDASPRPGIGSGYGQYVLALLS